MNGVFLAAFNALGAKNAVPVIIDQKGVTEHRTAFLLILGPETDMFPATIQAEMAIGA